MNLYRLRIEGFRRIKSSEFIFGDATFLIGQNNCGKSSVLLAIETLLSAKKQLNSSEFYSVLDEETGETKVESTSVILEAEFRNLPVESASWRGFKGRIFEYDTDDENDSGLSITYRKTFELGKDVIVELKQKIRSQKEEFENCSTPNNFVEAGLKKEIITDLFEESKLDKPIKAKTELEKLQYIDEIWNFSEENTWFQNPGGIPGNVLKMLPRFLLIPAETSLNEINGKSGVLQKTLIELFKDVRDASTNYTEAQRYLNLLQEELNPSDHQSEFGKLIIELNEVLSSVFPDTQFHATADLSDPEKSIHPMFSIEMSSNIRTDVNYQGSGMIRSAAFAMLRFRQNWLSLREDEHERSLIICFEEPETFLHPSAATQMRDAIYELSGARSQIVATTHSPYLIDLSRKPRQVLNRMAQYGNEVTNNPFNVTTAFRQLQEADKDYVKMLLKIDDYIAKVFFVSDVIIVEGDTEEILLRETLKRVGSEDSLKIRSNVEVVKARGKAAIIGLVKYLTSMGIKPIVVHDRDGEVKGAVVFNQPIAEAVGTNGRIIQMFENVEDELGYSASSEKPFKAYKKTQEWGDNWTDIPKAWRDKVKEIYGDYLIDYN